MTCHVPYAPLGVLKGVAADVWVVDGPEIEFRLLGLSAPFPTRATVIRLPGNALWVHSPVALSDGLATALESLGEVRFLVAPNTLHGSFIADWKARWPSARSYGPTASRVRGAASGDIDEHLTSHPPDAWGGALEQVVAASGIFTEVVFLHRPSRTLVLTDLIENFEAERVCWRWRCVVRLAGCVDPNGKAPIDMQLGFFRSRRRLRRAVDQMIAWAPERVLLAHGRCYLENGTLELRRAFRWVGT